MRLSAPALLIAGLFIAACSGSTTVTNDGGTHNGSCSSARDCPASDPSQCTAPKVCVCSSQMCVPTCSTNADCASPQICIEATCTNPGCGRDQDCSTGQACINGACGAPTAASAIHSCVIAPQSATVHITGTVQLSAVAQDSSGNALPFTGTAWSATGAATIASGTGLVTGGSAAGSATVTATMGTVTCTAAVAVYGAVAASSLRVVVIDADTKVPIQGAFVAMDTAATKATTAADGSATFALAAGSGAHNIHAFAQNHNYASYMAVTGTDLLIPLRQFYPIAERAPFNGVVTTNDFLTLNEVGQIVHVAFYGSSIAGSILDFNFDDFLGEGRNVNVSVAGNNFAIPKAPKGLVLGLADDLFTSGADGGTAAETSTYSMYADPGPRALWGIGGNLDLSTLLTIATPIINGGTSNLNIGTLLPQVLPFLGNLEVGTVVGAEAGASGPSPVGKNQNVTLDTPMHMNVAIKSPNLPKYNGAYLDGVIALTGAAAFPIGFTPLGLTAGIAATDSSGNKTGAITDPKCTVSATVTSCATNNLPLTMAPRNHGLESYPYGAVLVALNFSSLSSGTGSLALSGIAQAQDGIAFSGGTAAPTVVDLSSTPFMKLPGSTGNVEYTKATRKLTITSDADSTVQIYKFTLQSGSHQAWSVYVPPAGSTGSSATLINPADVNASLVDLQADTTGTGYIEAVSTNSASNNYASLTGFGNVTVDALGNNLKAFAVQTVTIAP
jgi:hypothetical protein